MTTRPRKHLRLTALLLPPLFLAVTPARADLSHCWALLKTSPWYLFEYFQTPLALKNAESIRLKTSELNIARGKLIRPAADGSPIERYAYRIHKITGYSVSLSDEANDLRKTRGFVSDKITVLTANENPGKMKIVNLGLREAKVKKNLSYVAAHESTHAYLYYMESIGEGTPLSVGFQDHGQNYSGPYSVGLDAQELKTWTQDAVRIIRARPEAEIQHLFHLNSKVRTKEVFRDWSLSQEKLEVVLILAARIRKDLKHALEALAKVPRELKNPEAFSKALFSTDEAGVLNIRKKFTVQLTKERKVFIPLNTRIEWDLALEFESRRVAGDSTDAVYLKLIALWSEKLHELDLYSSVLEQWIPGQIEILEKIGKTPEFSLEQYNEVREKLGFIGNLSSRMTRR
ncbi:MAG: hypothetical protein H7301_10585 [Cryobacterium sp.]|nr:hypothetical protein [Oligoflexia bacterium]